MTSFFDFPKGSALGVPWQSTGIVMKLEQSFRKYIHKVIYKLRSIELNMSKSEEDTLACKIKHKGKEHYLCSAIPTLQKQNPKVISVLVSWQRALLFTVTSKLPRVLLNKENSSLKIYTIETQRRGTGLRHRAAARHGAPRHSSSPSDAKDMAAASTTVHRTPLKRYERQET